MSKLKALKGSVRSLLQKGVLHIFIGTCIAKFAELFSSALFSHMFDKNDFGIINYVENMYSYVFLAAGLGLTYIIYRYVVKADDLREKHSYYSYAVKRAAMYDAVIFGIAVVVFLFVFPYKDGYEKAKYLMPVILLALPFQSFFNSNLAVFRSMFDNKRYAVYACLTGLVFVGVKFLFAALFKIDGIFFARSIVYFAAGVTSYLVIKSKFFENRSLFKADKVTTKKQIEFHKYGIQCMITNGIWILFSLNEVLLMGLLGNPEGVADYKTALLFPSGLGLMSVAINVFVTPYFVKHEDDHKWVRKNLFRTILATAVPVGITGVLMCVLSRFILNIYNPDYVNVAPLMCILVVAQSVSLVFRGNFANVLTATGRVTTNLLISFGGLLLQVAVVMLFTRNYGEYGIALTSVAVYILMSVALCIAFLIHFKDDKKEQREAN